MGLKEIREGRAKAARAEAARYSQQALAEVLGVTPARVSQMEADPGSIRLEQAQRLAEYLGTTPEALLPARGPQLN